MTIFQLTCGHMSNGPSCPLCAPTRRVSRPKGKRAPYRPRGGYSPASRAAYGQLSAADVAYQYRLILAAIDANPEGLTRLEIHHKTGIAEKAVTPRVYELMGKDRHAPQFRDNPVLAELPVTRRNPGTGVHAAVLVRAGRVDEVAGRLGI